MPTETLTSRQRVINTFNGQPVDRYPIDLGAYTASGISMFAYHNLRKYLGLDTDNIRVHDMVQCLASVDQDIHDRFHLDCIHIEPPYAKTIRWNPREDYQFVIPAGANPQPTDDGGWVIARDEFSMTMPPTSYFFDGHWLNNWGEGNEDDRVKLYAESAERLYKETDYALIFGGYSHGLGIAAFGAGSIDDAILAYDDPQLLHERRRETLATNIKRMGKIIDTFGKYINVVTISDDMGTQNGPMCSPDYIQEFAIAYYKKFCDFVHQNSDIKVFLHCCGSIRQVIPLIIEAGFDILNPVQISAANMNPDDLVKEFGDKICFWGGGCNTQQVLAAGSPDDVAENVRQLSNTFKPTGRFIFNQVHNIMGNVQPENIVAMLDTAYEQSFYGQS